MFTFWDERFWCPPGVKWSDFGPDNPQFNDIYYSFVTAGILMLFRFLLEIALFRPFGRYMCNKGERHGGDSIKSKRLNDKTVLKIGEGMWRLSFYSFSAIYGWFFVLWSKPYLHDTTQALYNYPHHPVTNDEWWLYNIELGFYVSLVITQIIDTKRKDFWQMFIHHIVTIILIVLSWACNFHRIGVLVMVIHDVADIPLEGAKLAKYCQLQRLADIIFAIFTVTWIYSRCYLLPTRVIYYTAHEALSIVPIFPAYYIFNLLICSLQLLHILWTWLIMRIVFYALKNDGMRDLRSDSEDDAAHELHTD